ncbi:MAG: DMT family transporter, partial [Thermoanaerobaculia bacterium]
MEARTGEIAGLFASFAWAIGSLVYSRARAAPAALNLFKNSVAAVMFAGTLLLLPRARIDALWSARPATWGWLALSAFIGLFLGDTFYFRSLQALGPRRALVLTTLTPVLAAGLGFWLLGQLLTGSVWLG